jgi:hypothetical protein
MGRILLIVNTLYLLNCAHTTIHTVCHRQNQGDSNCRRAIHVVVRVEAATGVYCPRLVTCEASVFARPACWEEMIIARGGGRIGLEGN